MGLRLSRKKRRWIRRNKGLLTILAFLIILLICVLIYIAVLFNKEENNTQQSENNTELSTEKESTVGETQEQSTTLVVFEPTTEETTEATTEYVTTAEMEYPYYIKVNRVMNCITVYGLDENGEYTIPVKAIICSTGKNVGDTPLDISQTTDKYVFHPMVDGSYAQYAYRFNTGGIMFHSVPYYTQNKGDLETEQFNLLGSVASLGCVRMCVRDMLWIYENCPVGTTVEVYDDESSPGPLGKPEMIKIPVDSPYAGWDPTDPDVNNPWHNFSAEIHGTADVVLTVGSQFDPYAGITATDTCGNDITDRIVITGSYDTGVAGEYQLTYTVTDLIDSTDTKTIKITVMQ